MRKFLKDIKERFVSTLISVFKNGIKIADGLVIVRTKNEVDFFHDECSNGFLDAKVKKMMRHRQTQLP
jgi:5,10-methylenetetrahydrofolate reductase